MFRFNDIDWLWALLVVPALAALFLSAARGRIRALEQFADAELVDRLTASVHHSARRWKAACGLLAVTLLVVALARPQFGTRLETVTARGQDIVIAVDLSQSMLAEDVTPNRLDRARLFVLQLMEQLNGDRIGLVAFAADAFIQSPLTVDYRAAAMFLSAMHPDLMPVQGTDLGEALRVSADALEEGAREARVLILITDAEDHEGQYGPELERLRDLGVTAHVVLIGTAEGAPIPVFDEAGTQQGFLRDEDGSVVTTRIDDSVVDSFRQAGGFNVVLAGASGTAIDDLIDEIARGEGEEIEARQVTRFEEQYQVFLGLALLLLVASMLISDRRATGHEWVGRFE
jgi:Ca-activated chloride channel family protein